MVIVVDPGGDKHAYQIGRYIEVTDGHLIIRDSIGGTTITNTSNLHTAMAAFSVGQTVTLTWVDASAASHSASVTLGQASFPD